MGIVMFFEFAGVVLIIVGLLNEKKLIAFEDRISRKFKRWLNKRIRQKAFNNKR